MTSSAPPRPDASRRLRGSDSGFLYVESESQTSTCTYVVELAPPCDGASTLTSADLQAHLERHLTRVPQLRRRIHQVPGGIGHPVWADDASFVLADHLEHHHLKADEATAGSAAQQLEAHLASVTTVRLPLDRPLWQIRLVDGFSDGSQVLLLLLHHTMGDGGALTQLVRQICDDRVLGEPSVVSELDARPHRAPSTIGLFLSSFGRLCAAVLSLPWLLGQSMRRIKAVRERRESSDVKVPGMAGTAPVTVLNRSADNQRRVARSVLSISDLKAVKQASGASVSDVLVTVLAGALRTHLLGRNELPEEPLVVNVPLGNEAPGTAPRLRGNVFVNFYAYLPTHLADPRGRLASTVAHNREAREQLDLQGRDIIPRWLDRIPPAIAWRAAQKMAAQHREGDVPPDFNVLVSNVPSPASEWTLGGRVVRSMFIIGPVTDGFGLNVTAVGYGDDLTVTLHSNPASVDDLAALAGDVTASLRELVEAYAVTDTHSGLDSSEVA